MELCRRGDFQKDHIGSVFLATSLKCMGEVNFKRTHSVCVSFYAMCLFWNHLTQMCEDLVVKIGSIVFDRSETLTESKNTRYYGHVKMSAFEKTHTHMGERLR